MRDKPYLVAACSGLAATIHHDLRVTVRGPKVRLDSFPHATLPQALETMRGWLKDLRPTAHHRQYFVLDRTAEYVS